MSRSARRKRTLISVLVTGVLLLASVALRPLLCIPSLCPMSGAFVVNCSCSWHAAVPVPHDCPCPDCSAIVFGPPGDRCKVACIGGRRGTRCECEACKERWFGGVTRPIGSDPNDSIQ